ncbi:MAG: cysteine--tRNA ligase, partial [Xanthobacteraceae bacterium]
DDVAALGCLSPTYEPRATEYISNPSAATDMVRLIERLIANGNAYVAEGHVLFHVPSMPDYGKLSNRPLDEMIAGARVEVAPYKRDPQDFVLWKPSSPELPGWESPWGRGRPGWHIECSAMSAALLGETFDIHGGGIDLVFPHHENEIAQSRCAFHTGAMANTWMHNGFLQVEGEKMAKSAGNFVTIHELLADWPGDVLRLAMLGSHYRQPINWTLKNLNEAEKALASWFDAAAEEAEPRPAPAVIEALADDLNTPRAIAEIHALANRAGHKSVAGTLAFLGLRREIFEEWRQRRAPALAISEAEIAARIATRLEARKAKNFAESDRIRDELAAMGVVLKDSKEGTTWEVAR